MPKKKKDGFKFKDSLTMIPDALKWAAKQDVERLRVKAIQEYKKMMSKVKT